MATLVAVALVPSLANAASTCAVLTIGDLGSESRAIADLLEVELSQNGALSVLARQDLEEILAERSIQMTSLATDRDAARKLGSILRVDLLVLIEEEKTAESVLIDIKAVETRHGLRLVSEAFEIDDGIDRLVDLLTTLVVDAAKVDPKDFRYIFAVPPFELGGLSFEDAHLQHVFANVVSNVIRSMESAVVVDLAHAGEVAEELAMTSGRATVDRPLPYYIVGRFKSNGVTDQRRLTVTVELRHGDASLEKVEQSGLQATGVVEFLQTKTVDLLARHLAMGHAPVAKYNRTLEARLLDERSRAAAARSDWVTAIELAEAGLLLDPSRTPLHLRIVKYCIRFVSGYPTWENPHANAASLQGGLPPAELIAPRDRFRFAQIGLLHARHVFLHVPSNDRAVGSAIRTVLRLFYATTHLHSHPYDWETDPHSLKKLQLDIGETEVELVHAILTDQRISPALTRIDLWDIAGMTRVATNNLADVAPGGRVNAMKAIIRDFAGFDCGFHAQCRVFAWNWTLARDHPAVFDGLISELAGDHNQQTSLTLDIVREVRSLRDREDAAAVQQRIDAMIGAALSSPTAPFTCEGKTTPGELIDNYLYEFRIRGQGGHRELQGCPPDVEFVAMSGPGVEQPFPLKLARLDRGGWVRGGGKTDFIHWSNRLFRMRERGKPIEIHGLPSQSKIQDVCWDGTYLWVVQADTDGQITVFDGRTFQRLTVFGKADGVPSTLRAARIAVVRPGQVCVAASFGRSWIGLLTYDTKVGATASKEVDILMAATKAGKKHKLNRPDLYRVFDPSFADSWYSPSLGRRIVVVGRYLPREHRLRVPYTVTHDFLVVDPAKRKVTPLHGSWNWGSPLPIPADEGLYVYAAHGLHLCTPPNMKCDRLFELKPPLPKTKATIFVTSVAADSEIHFWWSLLDPVEHEYYSWLATVDVAQGRQTRECRTNRWIYDAKLFWTSHYGLVVQAPEVEGAWQVVLPE